MGLDEEAGDDILAAGAADIPVFFAVADDEGWVGDFVVVGLGWAGEVDFDSADGVVTKDEDDEVEEMGDLSLLIAEAEAGGEA